MCKRERGVFYPCVCERQHDDDCREVKEKEKRKAAPTCVVGFTFASRTTTNQSIPSYNVPTIAYSAVVIGLASTLKNFLFCRPFLRHHWTVGKQTTKLINRSCGISIPYNLQLDCSRLTTTTTCWHSSSSCFGGIFSD